jgi:DNA polymerase-3 subunit epsilon
MADSVGRIIVFDVETTGTDKRSDQVIELCMQFGLRGDAPSRVWRFLPDVPISPGAQAVHGISMADLAGCPSFAACADEIRALFVGSEILVGYNLAFDIEMLQAEFERLRQPMLDLSDKKIIDPFRLWQQCEPRSLQDAHRRFVGDAFSAAHSAQADVAATGRVLLGMLDSFGLAGKDWGRIAAVCEPDRLHWIGPSRHLRWTEDGSAIVNFGKHAGKPLSELARGQEAGYIRWLLEKDFPAHVREICRRALELDVGALHQWLCSHYGGPPDKAPGMPRPNEDRGTSPVAAAVSVEGQLL